MNKKLGEIYKYFEARYLKRWWLYFGDKHGGVPSA